MSALAAASALATGFGSLNVYWGQYGSDRLRDHCDTGVEYVSLSFVNKAPENDPSGYPGTNFANHCWAGYYVNEDDVESALLNNCIYIKEDIPYCQSRGVKVLLSIGGVYNDNTNNYKVSSIENGQYFADFLWKAFGPYDQNWTGPRPFDKSPTEHMAIDGFDFDIEHELDNKPYIAMIERFRSYNPSIFISAAPQCPTSDMYFHLKELVQKAQLDALFVQFYNNPWCDAVKDPLLIGEAFNYDEWEGIISRSTKSKNAKLYVGLPGSQAAAGSGYVTPAALKDLVCKNKDKKSWGGISLWDVTYAKENKDSKGKTYFQAAQEALQYGCSPVPTSTSTTIKPTSTTKSSTSTKATTTSTTTKASSTSTKASSTSTKASSTSTKASSTSTKASSTSTKASSTSTKASSTSTKASSTSAKPSSTSTKASSTSTKASSTSTKASSTSTKASSTSTKASSTSTKASSTSTKASSTSVKPSSTSTKASSTSTKASSTSTKASSTSTKASSTSTKASTSAKPSSTSTKASSTSTKASSTSTKASSTSVKPSSTSTKASTSVKPSSTSTKASSTSAKPSSTSTKASSTSTKASTSAKPSSTSTKASSTSTKASSTSAKPSSTSTKASSTSTKASSSVKPSSTSTKASTSVKPSSTSTKASSTSTKASSTSAKPSSTSQASSASVKPSSTSSKASSSTLVSSSSSKASSISSTAKVSSTSSASSSSSSSSSGGGITGDIPRGSSTSSAIVSVTSTNEVPRGSSTSSSPSASSLQTSSSPVVVVPSSTFSWSNSSITTSATSGSGAAVTSSVRLTTSTVYTTKVSTVTKCPPSVPNCPSGGYVTTETIPLYTTVCPVTESGGVQPTTTAASVPLTTSTVFATKTYVVTACPPEVVNCPVGQVTTEVTSYTTVCPVTSTETIPEPTGPASEVPAEGGFNIKATSSLQVISVPAPSGLATSTRPAATTLVPAPPAKGCSGPGCPVEYHVAIPSNKSVWSNGTHTEAPSSYSKPTSAYATPSSTYSKPSETPAVPATGGASGLAVSITGFLAVAALQVLFL